MELKQIIKEELDNAQDSLIKKWAENEHKLNIMRFNNQMPDDVFPQDEFDKINQSNREIENKLSAGNNYDWIDIASKYLDQFNKEYGFKNPGFRDWADQSDYEIDAEEIRERTVPKEVKPKKVSFKRVKHNSKNSIDKATPRSWSAKYWKENPVSSVIAEILDPKNVEVDTLKNHDILNTEIWESEKLKPEVRRALLKNAVAFLDYVGLGGLKIYDVVLTGSLANYNYTQGSDLDLHIVVDFNKVGDNIDIVRELFKEKKDGWNLTKDIKIKGFDVESYLQDVNEPNTLGSGIYSVYRDEWVEKPNRKITTIDKESIQVKAADIMNAVDSLESIQDADAGLAKLKKVKERIVKLRKTGLEKEGEFSLENLVFKILKHTGYIDKLQDYKKQYMEKSLSVPENNIIKK